MRILAYLARGIEQPWAWLSSWRLVDAEMVTCPPWYAVEWRPDDFEGWDLLIFKLYGMPDQPYWYGEGMRTALRADTLREADLRDVVVFAANCYGLDDDGRPGRMVQALMDAGARAVVAGGGANYAGKGPDQVGADLLGKWFVWGVRLGFDVERAFKIARHRVGLGAVAGKQGKRMAAKDAVDFKLIRRV